MLKATKLKKGLNIKLNGEAKLEMLPSNSSSLFAIRPTDFRSLIPKLSVKVDEYVKAGEPLFFDKANPEILFTSPVSGKIEAINRGERRKILEVVVKKDDGDIDYKDFGTENLSTLKREDIISKMLNSGVWPMLKQRPYGIIANPNDVPKAIFISGFDTAPLAASLDFITQDFAKELQEGINCLNKLCNDNLILSLKAGEKSKTLNGLTNVKKHHFSGKHPAGNVGVQIHHINPINKGDKVWTVNIQDLIIIGRLFLTGKYDARKIIALAGSEVKNPGYYNVISGEEIKSIVDGKISNTNNRIISGNVLTGTKEELNGFLGFYSNQITVIPEGNHYEFLGWAMPGFNKFSASKLFASFLFPNKKYSLDTNYNGERRAFVINGQYEKVVPMDIYPVYLLKAILAKDITQMEQLGIYEVIPEDFALCEFVCTSKIQVQQIMEDGIDIMLKEVG